MTFIVLERLTKRYGAASAIEGLDLEIPAGSLFFVIGPSGCGKTTLLRMIGGFVEPTAGRVLFDRRDVTRVPPNRRDAAMVFQSYALWPHMSVADNVAYGLRVRRVPAADRCGRVEAALRAVRMDGLGQRKPSELSGGQQQRVALARALVVQPRVLLLDEPLSNLDARLRVEMRDEIRRICRESGISTVYVTHDQTEALSMADRIALLREGHLVQVGAPRELYSRPATRFAATFLGRTNLIEGRLVGRRDGTLAIRTAAGILTSTAPAGTLHEGEPVTCSIRPEAVRIVRSGAAPTVNHLMGRVTRTVYLGHMAEHGIDVAPGLTMSALVLNPPDVPGDNVEVAVTIDPEDVVIVND
jgi:iron(III) transport system ATP-binding protein